MPAFSPSACASALPKQMPTSSTVWCASTCRSPSAFDGQVDEAVPGEQRQHVVEEADAGGDLGLAGAVEVEGQLDLRLAGFAVDTCGRERGLPPELVQSAWSVRFSSLPLCSTGGAYQTSPVSSSSSRSISASVPTVMRRPSP